VGLWIAAEVMRRARGSNAAKLWECPRLRLKYEGADIKAVSQEFRDIESKTLDEWPLLNPAAADVATAEAAQQTKQG
jgi:hypothetical protein